MGPVPVLRILSTPMPSLLSRVPIMRRPAMRMPTALASGGGSINGGGSKGPGGGGRGGNNNSNSNSGEGSFNWGRSLGMSMMTLAASSALSGPAFAAKKEEKKTEKVIMDQSDMTIESVTDMLWTLAGELPLGHHSFWAQGRGKMPRCCTALPSSPREHGASHV